MRIEMVDWSRSGSGLRGAQEETRQQLVGLLRHAMRDSGGRTTHLWDNLGIPDTA
jgi:hypothetical protein